MTEINKQAPVLVSGATGYVAAWIVKRLLEDGLSVHAAVRDPGNQDKIKYLDQLAEDAPGNLVYFKTDLLEEGSYGEAMSGCEVVFHTASPFTIGVSNPQKQLVDPALLGTRNVLEQANRTASVKRVVVTSSCAAIYGDNADLKDIPGGVCTEAIWNSSSSLSHQPYAYSKTLAEKEAWALHEKQDRWDLVTINPSLVIGPAINPYGSSESFTIIKQLGDGSMKTGAPRWGMGVVDVRDVAEAHLKAAFVPGAKGRYIVSAHNTDLVEMAGQLLDKYGDRYPIPRKAVPKFLVWLFAPLVNKSVTRRIISRNIDIAWAGDNSKGVNELGLSYRPLKESMEEFFQQMIEVGLISKSKK